jgi:mating pheromone-induced death protein 2
MASARVCLSSSAQMDTVLNDDLSPQQLSSTNITDDPLLCFQDRDTQPAPSSLLDEGILLNSNDTTLHHSTMRWNETWSRTSKCTSTVQHQQQPQPQQQQQHHNQQQRLLSNNCRGLLGRKDGSCPPSPPQRSWLCASKTPTFNDSNTSHHSTRGIGGGRRDSTIGKMQTLQQRSGVANKPRRSYHRAMSSNALLTSSGLSESSRGHHSHHLSSSTIRSNNSGQSSYSSSFSSSLSLSSPRVVVASVTLDEATSDSLLLKNDSNHSASAVRVRRPFAFDRAQSESCLFVHGSRRGGDIEVLPLIEHDKKKLMKKRLDMMVRRASERSMCSQSTNKSNTTTTTSTSTTTTNNNCGGPPNKVKGANSRRSKSLRRRSQASTRSSTTTSSSSRSSNMKTSPRTSRKDNRRSSDPRSNTESVVGSHSIDNKRCL